MAKQKTLKQYRKVITDFAKYTKELGLDYTDFLYFNERCWKESEEVA